ncbi:septum formation inhibitor Maf [Hydrogenovibrio sp. JE_KL2]|nr:Maf family nucleotide pyrophosphatase [Hydrogenovibrio sp. JE_KL2]MPQ77071.1 septum formation inhibitor Maf [Hydrogenovibrio sp. JE_KL2]
MQPLSELPPIILASTSAFRKQLLEKLCLPFTTAKPDIDETPLAQESVEEMVNRLSLAKANEVANTVKNAIIIASDQSAVFEEKPIGKPHNYENAFNQLKGFSGQSIAFLTGLVVIDQTRQKTYQSLDITKVFFRNLSDDDIHNYLMLEQPFECAGSFKSEGLGITLFEKIESSDPNALIGLPLIQLTTHLKACGIQLPYLKT